MYPIIGKTDTDLLPKQEAAVQTAIKQHVLASEHGLRQNVRATIAGKIFGYDLTTEPLRGAAGAVVGITSTTLDVAGHQRGGECL